MKIERVCYIWIYFKTMNHPIQSALLGLAVGDALGVPVEFLPREEISRNPVTDMREYGTHNQPAGTFLSLIHI